MPDGAASPCGVAVHAAQYSSSFAMKFSHSSRAMGVPNAP